MSDERESVAEALLELVQMAWSEGWEHRQRFSTVVWEGVPEKREFFNSIIDDWHALMDAKSRPDIQPGVCLECGFRDCPSNRSTEDE